MPQSDQPACLWTQDELDEFWETGCGEAFVFDDGDPEDNKFLFCPHCGKPLQTQDQENPDAPSR